MEFAFRQTILPPPGLSYIIGQRRPFWLIPVNPRGTRDATDFSNFSCCEAPDSYGIIPLL